MNSPNQETLTFECKLESILPNSSTDIYILKESYLDSDMLRSLPKEKMEVSVKRNQLRASLKSSCHSVSPSLLEEATISFWNSLIHTQCEYGVIREIIILDLIEIASLLEVITDSSSLIICVKFNDDLTIPILVTSEWPWHISKFLNLLNIKGHLKYISLATPLPFRKKKIHSIPISPR